MASWGALNSSTGQLIGSGPVPGLAQTIPRAELWAAICSLKWGLWRCVSIIIWSDSAYVVRGIRAILACDFVMPRDNSDLWLVVCELAHQYEPGALRAQHVPSHIDVAACDSPLEEWLAFWNGRADRLAGHANGNRGHELAQAHQAAVSHHLEQAAILDALFLVYSRIADATSAKAGRTRTEQDIELETAVPAAVPVAGACLRFAEEVPLDWVHQVSHVCKAFPSRFVQKAFEFLYLQDAASLTQYRLSWFELVVMFLQGAFAAFPVRQVTSGLWVEAASSPFSQLPVTLIAQLRVFRHVLRKGLRALSLQGLCVVSLDLSALGVGFPQDGILRCYSP